MIAWIVLIIAGLLETFGVAMMNQLAVDKNWKTLLWLIIGFSLSFTLLRYSLQYIPMGIGYAVWTGIGIAGGALVGMIFYGESKDWKRLTFIAMILGATAGLKIVS